MNTKSFQALVCKSFVFVGKKLTSKNAIAFYLSIALLVGLVIVAILVGLLMLVLLAIKPLVNHKNKHSTVKAESKLLSQVETKNDSLIQPRIFIAPAVGRAVNPLHFLGYIPGGMGGGVNYYAFADFRRWVEFDEKPEALLVTNEQLQTQLWKQYNDYELYCNLPVLVVANETSETKSIETIKTKVLAVDLSPAEQCSTRLAFIQLCWAAIYNLASAFSAVKVSDLKELASQYKIKNYRKMPKLELFLNLMECESL